MQHTLHGDVLVHVHYTETGMRCYASPQGVLGPEYATPGSIGLDLRACIEEESLEIPTGGRAKIPAGLAIEVLTPSIAGFVFSRSGLGAKHGLTVAQGVGVIDPDYRGEITIWLLNTSDMLRTVARGERVAQLLFLPVHTAKLVAVDSLSRTERGAGGFGHTGSR